LLWPPSTELALSVFAVVQVGVGTALEPDASTTAITDAVPSVVPNSSQRRTCRRASLLKLAILGPLIVS
jgi:hypothetical protein